MLRQLQLHLEATLTTWDPAKQGNKLHVLVEHWKLGNLSASKSSFAALEQEQQESRCLRLLHMNTGVFQRDGLLRKDLRAPNPGESCSLRDAGPACTC